MDIFEYALKMERDGENYYRRLVQQSKNKGFRTIFAMLADEEVKHANIIKEMKSGQAQPGETTILSDATNVFTQMKQSNERIDFDITQTELYKKAQELEKKSRDFYLEKSNEVQKDYQKKIFLKLADEEKRHYFLLENIINLVSRPDTWLENAEFYHLEEY